MSDVTIFEFDLDEIFVVWNEGDEIALAVFVLENGELRYFDKSSSKNRELLEEWDFFGVLPIGKYKDIVGISLEFLVDRGLRAFSTKNIKIS